MTFRLGLVGFVERVGGGAREAKESPPAGGPRSGTSSVDRGFEETGNDASLGRRRPAESLVVVSADGMVPGNCAILGPETESRGIHGLGVGVMIGSPAVENSCFCILGIVRLTMTGGGGIAARSRSAAERLPLASSPSRLVAISAVASTTS